MLSRAVIGALALTLVQAAHSTETLNSGAGPHADTGPGVAIRLPKNEAIMFRGLVNLDHAGTASGTMAYPAPSAVGLLVAVVTHAVLVETEKTRQKNRLQKAADTELAPYVSALEGYGQRQLMQRGLEKLIHPNPKRLLEADESPGPEWRLEVMPVYALTADQTAMTLENTIAVFAPTNATEAVYRNTFKVVSAPISASDLLEYWTADRGARLKEEGATLLAQSFAIALAEATAAPRPESPAKTYRYLEGRALKMERAHLIAESCERKVIKSLRGWILSVPIQPSSSSCAAGSAPD